MKKLSLKELNRVDIHTFKNQDKSPITIVLDNVRSMNNVGSAFRTSDCFALEKIYLCGITAKPPHRDIEKTALGATRSMEWEYIKESSQLVKQLKKEGYIVLAVEQTNESVFIHEYSPLAEEKYALVFGNEVNGVSDEVMALIDGCLEIPQFGTKHSFNISVSIGIVAWDFFSKTQLKVKRNSIP
ncbi:MAG TPA: RNA methyltransferase [Sphingobacterium sp.]|nr:RNA methyltransferase [Sphingobacterium sp.]